MYKKKKDWLSAFTRAAAAITQWLSYMLHICVIYVTLGIYGVICPKCLLQTFSWGDVNNPVCSPQIMYWWTKGMIPPPSSLMSWWVCWVYAQELGKVLPNSGCTTGSTHHQWWHHESLINGAMSSANFLPPLYPTIPISSSPLSNLLANSEANVEDTKRMSCYTVKFPLARQLSLKYISHFLQQDQCHSY